VSPRRFDGWEPAETHRYRYSRDGSRVASVRVTREPEWDEQDQAWALALDLYESQLGPCGHYLPHTAAADAEERYQSPEPGRCHACTATAIRAESYKDSPQPHALLFHAERR